jgi:hypothetical protein
LRTAIHGEEDFCLHRFVEDALVPVRENFFGISAPEAEAVLSQYVVSDVAKADVPLFESLEDAVSRVAILNFDMKGAFYLGYGQLEIAADCSSAMRPRTSRQSAPAGTVSPSASTSEDRGCSGIGYRRS